MEDYVIGLTAKNSYCALTNQQEVSQSGDDKQPYVHMLLGCFTQASLSRAAAIQTPLLKALGNEGKNVVVQILKTSGAFVYVDVHYRRTGHYAIMRKYKRVWKVIFSGQDHPECTVMKKNAVPKTIYGTCY